MPSSESLHAQPVDPLAPVTHLLDGLLHVAVTGAFGLVIGVLLALLMRESRLHWSWAACALGIVVVGGSLLATSASTIGVALLSATLLGRRWHRHDLAAGADLAASAADRRGPIDVLRFCAARASLRRRRRAADGWFRGDELILGRDERHRPVTVRCGADGDGPTRSSSARPARARRSPRAG
ncbi:MAG TPA: hypothetical protein VHY83_13220 [Solirubrobacteraceae bacterium]|jgi:hypothetical protein|nr:hypothetical protein [Solirubrobacteraceae bacterium]